MASVQFGLLLPPGANFLAGSTRATYPADLARAMDLVATHFDSAWWIDHLLMGARDLLECWTAICYLAGRYPSLHVGTMVLNQAFRNPGLLAKMAASLQVLTEGRLILGLGAGWNEDEHRAYGYDFPSAGVRITQLEECLAIVRALWNEEPATVAGQHVRIEEARCLPPPGAPPPIMIGAKRPRMLRVAARHADWWNGDWSNLERNREMIEQLDAACAEIGRDPSTLRKTWLGMIACQPTEAAARAEVATSYAYPGQVAASIVGTPTQVIDQFRAYQALGIDYFILCPHRFPDLSSLELLCSEVLPVVRAAADDGGFGLRNN